jgi:hypothetical protein
MYVGQVVDLKADIETAANLSLDEVEWLDLEWKSSNPTIVEVRDGKLIAHKLGTTMLQVNTRDGSYSDNMEIGVYPTVVDFTLPDNVIVNVGETYKPEATFRTIYRFDEPIIDTFNIEETGVYLSADYLEEQIAYYKLRKLDAEDVLRGEPYALTSIRAYNEQIAVLESILELKSGAYCKVSEENRKLIFDDFEFSKVDENTVIGLREGRIIFKLESKDNEREKPLSVIVNPGEMFKFRVIASDNQLLYEKSE